MGVRRERAAHSLRRRGEVELDARLQSWTLDPGPWTLDSLLERGEVELDARPHGRGDVGRVPQLTWVFGWLGARVRVRVRVGVGVE